MRKTTIVRYLSLALLGLLLYSCTSWNTSLGRKARYQYQAQQEVEFSSVRIQEPWWQEKQVFQVLADKDTVLYTAAGATLNYYSGSLLNEKKESIQGWVRLEVQEAYTPGDMILYDAATVSYGHMLESGGEINLRAFKGNEKLILDPNGIGLEVRLPTVVKENMELFSGLRYREGLNWAKDTLLKALNFDQPPVESNAAYLSYELDSNEIAIALANGDVSYLNVNEFEEQENYFFNTKKLGWINCDRFYNDSTEKTDFVVRLKTPLPEGYKTKAYLVFEGINSVMPVYFYDDLSFKAVDIPIGSKVKLVVLGEVDKLFYLEIQELEVSKEQVVWASLSPCNVEALKERLTEL